MKTGLGRAFGIFLGLIDMALIESIQLKKLEKIISLNDCAEEFKIIQIEKALLQKYSFSGGSTAAHKVEKKIKQMFDFFFEDVSEHEYKKNQIYLLARLTYSLVSRIAEQNFPESVLAHYPEAITRLIFLLDSAFTNNYRTDVDLFTRFEFVLGRRIPCGAQSLDLCSSIPLSSALLSVPRQGSLMPLVNYLKSGGGGRWFRGHTDTEYLDEFNEKGWSMFYLNVAKLLNQYRNVKGYVGTSWYYAPEVLMISPHLSYLQTVRLNNGAFRIKHSPSKVDADFATHSSKTRKKLYEAGKYVPCSYSIIWPREKLLQWAKNYNRSIIKG